MARDRFGDAANKKSVAPFPSMRSHYNQLRLPLRGLIDDLGLRVSLLDRCLGLVTRIAQQAFSLLYYLPAVFQTFLPESHPIGN